MIRFKDLSIYVEFGEIIMKIFKVSFTLVLVGLVLAQNLGNPSRAFFTGGGCSQIAGVGSPILMVSHAHKFVNDALNSQNPHTDVNLVYYETPVVQPNGQTLYKFVFSVQDPRRLNFAGVEFLGGRRMSLLRLIFWDNIDRVGDILKITNLRGNAANISCGDLKFIFSSYGQKPTPDLPYAYSGRNGNLARLSLLTNLTEPDPGPQYPKLCIASNYADFILTDERVQNPADLVYCSAFGIPIREIRVSCRDNSDNIRSAGDNGSTTIKYLQLVYNDLSTNTAVDGDIVETRPTDPAWITTINVDQAHKIRFIRHNSRSYIIETLDTEDSVIDTWNCGKDQLNNETDSITVFVQNFLGFREIDTHGNMSEQIKAVYYIG